MIKKAGAKMVAKTVVIAGSVHGALAEAVAAELGCGVVWPEVLKFPSGEMGVVVEGELRDVRAVMVQGFVGDVQAALMEVCLLADAVRRCGANEVILVAPYLPYGRADKPWAGYALAAEVVAKMLGAAGVDRVVTLEPHSARVVAAYAGADTPELVVVPQVEIFTPVVAAALGDMAREVCVVAPDAGAAERAGALRDGLVAAWGGDVRLVVMDKVRGVDGAVQKMRVGDEVAGRQVVVVDDMVDTAGTLVAVVDALRSAGAAEVSVVAAHGILSGEALRRLMGMGLAHLWLSDSLPIAEEVRVLRGLGVVPTAAALVAAL